MYWLSTLSYLWIGSIFDDTWYMIYGFVNANNAFGVGLLFWFLNLILTLDNLELKAIQV